MTKPIPTASGARRRSFDASFKRQDVKMIRKQHLSGTQVYRDMNLVDSAVRRWIAQFDADAIGQPGMGKPLSEEQLRIRQLEAELRQVRSDNDLLKKHRPFLPMRSDPLAPPATGETVPVWAALLYQSFANSEHPAANK